jgi:hypothetical protein
MRESCPRCGFDPEDPATVARVATAMAHALAPLLTQLVGQSHGEVNLIPVAHTVLHAVFDDDL